MGEGSHVYGVSRRRTEKGYTQKMIRNIVGLESRIRQNRDESLHFFNSKGDLLHTMQGKGAGVQSDGYRPPRNAILTHNHPRALGKTGLESIGNSFSWQDIRTAIMSDAKEIRAVTPTYTFSLKRPGKGWGVDVDEFYKEYMSTNQQVKSNNLKYISERYNTNDLPARRASVTHYHDVVGRMAKKYGWKYSKTKG